MRALRRILTTILCASLVMPAAIAQQAAVKTRASQKARHAPKLVVVLVVDQMRGDYIERYGHQWTKGLRRLVERGAWFRQAAYPYMNTITCAGHATISTGSVPATHGVILNAWWDREAGKQVSCTEDPRAQTISYGAPAKGNHSAFRLEVPTLADELRVQTGAGSRVVTLAVKARGAIMLAGHRADAATWFDSSSGAWVTTTAYTSSPVPFVEKFVKSHPVERDFGKTWTRALPESAYLFQDSAAGEKPPRGWSGTFPHALRGRVEKPDAQFYGMWTESPLADAYVGKMAAAAVDALGLGKAAGTDYLAVSFDVLDSVGHDFGPQSHEVQDVLVHLDATLGKLFINLDRAVGTANYVVAFSADHGVAPIPEQMVAQGIDAGRVVIQDVTARIEKALEPSLGAGKHVARMSYPDVYFAPGVYQKMDADPAMMKAVLDAVRATAGVWRVYRREEMKAARESQDATARAVALSYYEGRSGDLMVVPRPYWFFVNASNETPPGSAATHGTSHGYDQRVPVILMGRGIKAGEYLSAASPADIAPTLALLCGITLARADGRVLAEALELRPASRQTGGGPGTEKKN